MALLTDDDPAPLIKNLKPDVVAGSLHPDEGEHVRSYGGEVFMADRLPEPSKAAE